MELDNLCDHGVEFLPAALEDEIVEIFPDTRFIRRDGEHIQSVNIMELSRFRFSRAGHAGQTCVETEVVLDGDGGVSHVFGLHFHSLLRLDSLVQTLAPAATRHFTTGVLVNDDDLSVLHDVFFVTLVD